MLKEERFEIILRELAVPRKVKFEELAVLLAVSEDTIRRDIDLLYRNGLLSKTRGGAILREKDPLTFQDRQSFLTKEKDIIALKVQPFLKDGMTLFVDGGTTTRAVVNAMPLDIRIRMFQIIFPSCHCSRSSKMWNLFFWVVILNPIWL